MSHLCKLNWCDSGWWRYQLNTNWWCQSGIPTQCGNASDWSWWENLQLMQVAPSCGQFFNSCKWCHLVAKFGTNASDAIWWPIFQLMQLMQVAPSCDQFFNSCKWRHLVAKFGTNASGATISWRDNSSLDAIPWVRCASGNVFYGQMMGKLTPIWSRSSSPWYQGKAVLYSNVKTCHVEISRKKRVQTQMGTIWPPADPQMDLETVFFSEMPETLQRKRWHDKLGWENTHWQILPAFIHIFTYIFIKWSS